MIKLKTELLKNMVNKSIKVCSFIEMLPITKFMEIKIEKGIISLHTTDNVTNLIIKEKIADETTEFRTVVSAALFTSLINKITSEEITMSMEASGLVLTGNGIYHIEVGVDENGSLIKFPAMNNMDESLFKELDFKELSAKIGLVTSAIPEDMLMPELSNYLIGKNIIATNSYKISSIEGLSGVENNMIVKQRLGQIISGLDYDKAKYAIDNEKITFISDNFILDSLVNEDLDKYPIDSINQLLESEFNYNVTIKRKPLLELLDRLTLFMDDYGKNIIDISFKKDNMRIVSNNKKGDENFVYTKSDIKDLTEFNCSTNIKTLKDQVDSLVTEEITIHFSSDNAIKLTDGKLTQIVCLVEE